MSFYNIHSSRRGGLDGLLKSATDGDISRALERETPGEEDFLAFLSAGAAGRLEELAVKANERGLRNFGRVIQLYAPLYLGNFCENECVYCGFRRSSRIARKKLDLEEVENEAKALSRSGIRDVLMLTGESRTLTPPAYLAACAELLKRYFASVSVEVYPLGREEYAELVSAGADGLAIYQETYDEELYAELHPSGPKRDYRGRLDAPERGCLAGMRRVNVGALLGLSDFRREIFFTGLHAAYLRDSFPGVEISVSLPRLRPQQGGFSPLSEVSDRDFVQAMLALRLFLPRAGISVSTRESGGFRKDLIGLGVTRMSAGSRTGVGGYSSPERTEGQFSVSDKSGLEAVKSLIRARGYQPVMKDWQ
ncbi:MAG: 2-iminoacetate synthase ThiH [Elusimicrobia bacterium]|nr:2-iminoacetate synthase ThiH [Elusimicrobiota bacterium]